MEDDVRRMLSPHSTSGPHNALTALLSCLLLTLSLTGCGDDSQGGPNNGQPEDAHWQDPPDLPDSDDHLDTPGDLVDEATDSSSDPPTDLGSDQGDLQEDPVGQRLTGPLPFYLDAERPFLMFEAEDLPAIRARVAEPGSVASLLFERVVSTCQRLPGTRPVAHIYDPRTECHNANIARACAFEGLVTEDRATLERAAGIFLAMQTDVFATEIGLDTLDKPTIYSGPAVLAYAQAYDLLLARPELAFAQEEDRERARELLLEHADNLHDFYMVDWPIVLPLTQNNHNIKHAAGIGMVGLAVPEDDRAIERLSFGVTELMLPAFERQYLEGGGWAEGPAYLAYSAVSYFPFLWALHRGLRGQNIDLYYSCRTALSLPCQPGVHTTADPWLDPRFLSLHQWAWDITLPNGMMTPFDDSGFSSLIWPFAQLQHGDGPWLWWWGRGPHAHTTAAAIELAPDILVLPIDLENVAAPLPEYPLNRLYYAGGQAVFRSGFASHDAFALLMGEHGRARQGGHEHPDATSFSWFVGGQYLLIDTGYFGFSQRHLTATADQHSLVLINGQGPPSGDFDGAYGVCVDSYLRDCELEDTPLPTCVVSTHYHATEVARRLVLIGDQALLLLDELNRESPAVFTHLLHTGAAPDNAALSAFGATWQVGSERVEAAVVSPLGQTSHHLDERVDTVTATGRHAVLKSELSSLGDNLILSLIMRSPLESPRHFVREEAEAEITLRISDGQNDLLVARLCDHELCQLRGLQLLVQTGDEGLLPGSGEILERQWPVGVNYE